MLFDLKASPTSASGCFTNSLPVSVQPMAILSPAGPGTQLMSGGTGNVACSILLEASSAPANANHSPTRTVEVIDQPQQSNYFALPVSNNNQQINSVNSLNSNPAPSSSHFPERQAHPVNGRVVPPFLTFNDLSSIPMQLSKLGISALPIGSIPIQHQQPQLLQTSCGTVNSGNYRSCNTLENCGSVLDTNLQRLPSMASLMSSASAGQQPTTNLSGVGGFNVAPEASAASGNVCHFMLNLSDANIDAGSKGSQVMQNASIQMIPLAGDQYLADTSHAVISTPYQHYLTTSDLNKPRLNNSTLRIDQSVSTASQVNFGVLNNEALSTEPSIRLSSAHSSQIAGIPSAYHPSQVMTPIQANTNSFISRNTNSLDLLVSAAHSIDYASSSGTTGNLGQVPPPSKGALLPPTSQSNRALVDQHEDSHCSSVSTLSADDACDFSSLFNASVGRNSVRLKNPGLDGSNENKGTLSVEYVRCASSKNLNSQSEMCNGTSDDQALALPNVAKPKYVRVRRADGTIYIAKVLASILPPPAARADSSSNYCNSSRLDTACLDSNVSLYGNFSVSNHEQMVNSAACSTTHVVTSTIRNHRIGLREPITYRPDVFLKKTRLVDGPDRAIAELKSEALMQYVRDVVKSCKESTEKVNEKSNNLQAATGVVSGSPGTILGRSSSAAVPISTYLSSGLAVPLAGGNTSSCTANGRTTLGNSVLPASAVTNTTSLMQVRLVPSANGNQLYAFTCAVPEPSQTSTSSSCDNLNINNLNHNSVSHNNAPNNTSTIDSTIDKVIRDNYSIYSDDSLTKIVNGNLLRKQGVVPIVSPSRLGGVPSGFSMPNGSISPDGSTAKSVSLHFDPAASTFSGSTSSHLVDQLTKRGIPQVLPFNKYGRGAKRKRGSSTNTAAHYLFDPGTSDSPDDLEFDGTIEMELSPTTKSRRLGTYPASGGFVNGNHAGFGEIPQIPGISEITESTKSNDNFTTLLNFEAADDYLMDADFEKDVLEIQANPHEHLVTPITSVVESKAIPTSNDGLPNDHVPCPRSPATDSTPVCAFVSLPSCSSSSFNNIPDVDDLMTSVKLENTPDTSALLNHLIPSDDSSLPLSFVNKFDESNAHKDAIVTNTTLADRNNVSNTQPIVTPDVKPDTDGSANNKFTTVRISRARKLTRKLRENLENYRILKESFVSPLPEDAETLVDVQPASPSPDLKPTFPAKIANKVGSVAEDKSLTCARARPYAGTKPFKCSRSVDCARMIPFDHKLHRRDFNWFYPFVHRCRVQPYTPRALRLDSSIARQSPGDEVAKSKYGNLLLATGLSLSLQYRLLPIRDPTVRLGRSGIHGVGLFSLRPVDIGELILEYVGQKIRPAVADFREKQYLKKHQRLDMKYVNMFRLDDEHVIDATLHGGLARFINHSCVPNCSARIINHHGVKKIVLVASRFIQTDDEICYNYKLPIENCETEKILCRCHTAGCRKYLN